MRRKYGVILVVACFVLVWKSTASAATHSLSSWNDTAYVGMVNVSGVGVVAAMCWRHGSTGVESLVVLRSGGGTGGLNEDVEIAAGEGNDFVHVVRTSGVTPPSSVDCSTAVTGTWSTLIANGYTVRIDAWSGNDTVEGPGGATATELLGYSGDDWLYNYSSVGEVSGESGNDEIISSGSGSAEVLRGGDGGDCLWDGNNAASTFDCGSGSGTDYYYYTNASIQTNCDSSALCCGLC